MTGGPCGSPENKMICRNCGTENKETSRFCKKCGTEIKLQNANNSSPRKKRFCIICGNEIGEDAAFCRICGAKIQDVYADADFHEENAVDDCTESIQNMDDTVVLHENSSNIVINPENFNNNSNEAKQINYNNSDDIAEGRHFSYQQNYRYDEVPFTDRVKPLTMYQYLGWILVYFWVPFGFIGALIHAFGNTRNENLKNFARGYLLFLLITIIISIFIYVVLIGVVIGGLSSLFNSYYL